MSRIYSDEAELYDIAFGWDVSAEVDWLVERLGRSCRTVLEPGCGTGRLLEALARRGLGVTGVDRSRAMVDYARRRLERAGVAGEVLVADMADFDLGRRFDGALSAVSTVGLLTPDGLASHLRATARHLEPGARYLVQQGIACEPAELWRSEWTAERDGVKLHVVWEAVERDAARRSERSRSRVEILTGPRAGEVVEDLHRSTVWTPESWRAAVDASPFSQAGCFDGALPDFPPVDVAGGGGLLWHEFVAA